MITVQKTWPIKTFDCEHWAGVCVSSGEGLGAPPGQRWLSGRLEGTCALKARSGRLVAASSRAQGGLQHTGEGLRGSARDSLGESGSVAVLHGRQDPVTSLMRGEMHV